MNTYRIDIFQNTAIVKTFETTKKQEAKNFYERNACKINQYTRLSVNGKALNTAKAENLLGKRNQQGIDYSVKSW
jgi:hypothetical protein